MPFQITITNTVFIKMSNTNTGSTLLIIPFSTSTSEFFCSAYQKRFKKQSGLSRHLTIMKNYNISRNDLESLSETNNKNIKISWSI